MSNFIAAQSYGLGGERDSFRSGGGLPIDADQVLALEAQNGNASAFAQVYDLYYDRVFRYAFSRIGNRAEAEDLAGDVFLKAFQSINSYRPQGAPFSAWLFRIAHNQVIDHLRRQSRRPTEELDERLPAHGRLPEEEVTELMTFEDVRQAMHYLTEAQQRVIALRFAADLSIAETAQIMGKAEGAIKALQHSAIGALRRQLQRDGYKLDEK